MRPADQIRCRVQVQSLLGIREPSLLDRAFYGRPRKWPPDMYRESTPLAQRVQPSRIPMWNPYTQNVTTARPFESSRSNRPDDQETPNRALHHILCSVE